MSVECTRWVWQHSRSRNSDRLVLLCIADHANPDGTGAYPSVGTIAAFTGLDERTVRYSLRYLEGLGELTVIPGGGPRGTHLYQVVMGEGGKVFPPANPSEGEKNSPCKDFPPAKISPNPPIEEEILDTQVSPSGREEDGSGEKNSPCKDFPPAKISPPVVPESLAGFERILRQSGRKGFSPSQQFYDKVASKYGHLDLEEEAIKMTGWLASKPSRPLSTAYILNWLKKAGEDAKRSGSNGYSRNTSRPNGISTDADRAFLDGVSSNVAR